MANVSIPLVGSVGWEYVINGIEFGPYEEFGSQSP